MHFLVDYENVRNTGMRGSEYLLQTDVLIVFFSSSAATMEARHLNNIRTSGCGFEICELFAQRKNALDFYIATKVGELFGKGECKTAVVISHDGGFKSLREFWQERSETENRIVLSDSIEHGIVSANEQSERAAIIREGRKQKDIACTHAALQAEIKQRRLLLSVFEGSAYADRLYDIQEVLQLSSLRHMYLESLHRFGFRAGLEVYAMLKGCAAALQAEQAALQ